MDLTLQVTKKESMNMSSLVKQMCSLKCRINVDLLSGRISIVDMDDENVESVIDAINEAFDITSVDIVPTVVVPEPELPVAIKDSEVCEQANEMLRVIHCAMYSNNAKSSDICEYLRTTSEEIAMKYNSKEPTDVSIGDVVECNYGFHLKGEISGRHVHSIVCNIDDDGMVYVLPITKDILKCDETRFLPFSVNLDVEYLTISNSANEDEIIVDNSAICGHETAVDAKTSVYKGLYNESEELTVTAKSNFFPTYTQTFDKDTDTITVTYYIKSDKSMENNQWVLTYDPSMLKYNESKNQNVSNFMPCVTNGGHANVPSEGTIKGNSTSLTLNKLKSSNGDKVGFVSVTFDVVGKGDTSVNLSVDYLTIGNLDSKTHMIDQSSEEAVIRNGKICDYTTAIDTSTLVYEGGYSGIDYVYGDVNLDGKIDITDATSIQKYIADMNKFTGLQEKLADVDGDGKVTVIDATLISRYLSSAKNTGRVGEDFK